MTFNTFLFMNLPSLPLKLCDTLASAASFGKEFHSFANTLDRKNSSFACFKPSFLWFNMMQDNYSIWRNNKQIHF